MTFGRVGIIGDSYSTFAGCIPEGFFSYYAPYKHPESGIVRREQTWWDLLIRETNSTLVMNNSFSGSTVCYTGRSDHPAWSAFAVRAPRYFDGSTPLDTIFFLGGTNDSWIGSPLGESTLKDWRDYTEEDKKDVLPAIGFVIGYLRAHYPAARIVTVVNDGLKPEIAETIRAAAKKNRCAVVELNGVSKVHGHPDVAGMIRIKDLIMETVKAQTNE